jgi:hypothetical protein
MRPEGVFTIFNTSPLDPVGREPQQGNVDHPDVWAQSECEKLQQRNQTYVKNDHHDEDVGRI